MSSLSSLSFNALTVKDNRDVPEDVMYLKFDEWFESRLQDSRTSAELGQHSSEALKEAAWNALVIDPVNADDGSAKWHKLKLNNPGNTKRMFVHMAAAWLGLESLTSADKKFMSVRKKTPIDAPAFISASDAASNGAKEFVKKNAPNRRWRRKRTCNGCGKTEDYVELCRSVYHKGTFCDKCLENGECETDPEGCSKWECIN